MKILSSILLFIFFWWQSDYCYSLENPAGNPADVNVIADLLEKDPLHIKIIDVRTPQEYKEGHLAGAVNINIFDPEFEKKLEKVPYSQSVILYCKSGVRSAQAEKRMRKAGYVNIMNMQGGLQAWQAAGKKIVR